jgi:PAS domain S-box-containing protein
VKNSRIFIIEDEFIIAEDIKSILENLGYVIAGISFSDENITRLIGESCPDLILMDIMLGGKTDGIEIAERLKKEFDIPLIYMTAYTDDTTLRRAKITEPLGYILKPFDKRELYATIEMALYKHNANIEIKKKQQSLQLITDFNERISTLSSSDIIKNSMLFIKEKLNFDHISIVLKEKDENSQKYRHIYFSIPGEDDENAVLSSDSSGIIDMENTKPIYRPDILNCPAGETDKSLLDNGIRSCFTSPLVAGNECIGTINVSSQKTDGISKADRETVSMLLAPRLALSIQNSMIFLELSRSEERFRSFANFLPQLIAEVKFDGKLVYVNNTAFTEYGYSKEDVDNGILVYDLVIPEEKERVIQNIQRLFRGEVVPALEYKAKKKDNTVIPVVIQTSILYNNNLPVGILALVVDITNLKAIEESLAKEKELLSVTLRSIGDGVITTDNNGRIILINKVAENLTGWNFTDAIGKELREVIDIKYERKNTNSEKSVHELVRATNSFSTNENIIITSRSGIEKIIEIKTSSLKDKENKNIGSVVVFHDITEKNKMQEEMIKIKKLESLGVLAGGIAHDFNNLLTAILGNITLAKIYTDQNDKAYEILLEAEKATLRSRDLTQQLLTFSKGGVPVKKVGSISDLIIESANFILRGSNIKCNFDFQQDLWSIEMDVGQINQVISNLLINACQAMKEGGKINIRGRNYVLSQENIIPLKKGNYTKIEFQDFGVGIPKENLQKIFDPYFTTKENGTGLGLAVTYSIIYKHNGYIEVNSKVGEGTTFALYLPASNHANQEQNAGSMEYPKQKGRILLMDDEKIIREVAYKMLTHLGFDVTLAENGEEVISLYKKSLDDHPFDAVIMDLTVPGGMGGKEVIKQLKAINPEINAIVSSGYTTDPVMSNFKEYGFKAIMIKPYKIENIIETLNSILK